MQYRVKALTMVNIKGGSTTCSVDPGVMVAMPGCRIKFVNLTSDEVHIQGSARELFVKPVRGYRGVGGHGFKVRPRANVTLAVGRLKRGVYPYAVFCECTSKYCTGGSMPIIIVPR